MSTSYSQVGQDLFAIEQNDFIDQGWFVDIGCAYAVTKNNTYLLEQKYSWKGLLLDSDSRYTNEISRMRSNSFVCADAISFNYKKHFQDNNFPNEIHYLSLDIDPPSNTLLVLEALPLDEYSFKCVTFEHDRYWFGDSVAVASREIFQDSGYTLFKKDVECSLGPFEDWYIKND